MKTIDTRKAHVVREFGPFTDGGRVHGVTWDGAHVWFASDTGLRSLDPETGAIDRTIDVTAPAGTAYDGRHLYQIAGDRILRIDPDSGSVIDSIPAPDGSNSGLAWAEGALWIGRYEDRKVLKLDPANGKVVKTIDSDRFVTGVTWLDGSLWHATWESERSDIRRVDAKTGEVMERLEMPEGMGVSGLESDGKHRFFAGGGGSGKLRVVARD